jgi:hypothetical protein
MIKQKFDEFIDSLEIPNDCLASFLTIMNAMIRSKIWVFKCEFENIELLELISDMLNIYFFYFHFTFTNINFTFISLSVILSQSE